MYIPCHREEAGWQACVQLAAQAASTPCLPLSPTARDLTPVMYVCQGPKEQRAPNTASITPKMEIPGAMVRGVTG